MSLDPVILFFALGVLVRLARSELRLPEALYETLSIYLLIAIGLKGGAQIAVQPLAELWPVALAAVALSADEWRDNVRLRYNHSPLDMPAACDGCGAKMTVEHALSCKVGGLVHIRHDDVADEWRHLCGTALSPGRVEREPPIFRCVSHWARVAAGNTTPPPPSTPTATPPTPPTTTEQRGDASCHGFWKRGRTCIFDMRITDTDAKSYRKKDFGKVLLQHEKEKKDKYLQTCLEFHANGVFG